MRPGVTIAADASDANFSGPASRRAWPKMIASLRGNALPIAITIGSLCAGAIYTWFAGEDVNWDWQNYHEYNVWAVLNGRYDTDALPAGFQTYFNPAVYFPVYFLRHLLPPPSGLLIIGAVHGLNLALVYWLSRVLLQNAATIGAVSASILIAAFGPMTLSEVGTSFSDILTALPVLAGFILILKADRAPAARYLLAGLLLGGRGRAEADQRRVRFGCRRGGSCVDPSAAGDDLPRPGRCARRPCDRRRVEPDAVAGNGQPDFPAVQRRVPVQGAGAEQHHGHAVFAARLLGRAGVSVLLAARRQPQFGISVPRCALCRRDGADAGRHCRAGCKTHSDFHAPGCSVLRHLRRFLCGVALAVFDPALRHRAGAAVRAADRAAARARDGACIRENLKRRRCVGSHSHRAVVAAGRLVAASLVRALPAENFGAARAARDLLSAGQARSPMSRRSSPRNRGSIRSPTSPCRCCRTAGSTAASAPGSKIRCRAARGNCTFAASRSARTCCSATILRSMHPNRASKSKAHSLGPRSRRAR